MTESELIAVRQDIQGNTKLTICNEEAGSFSQLWGRNCWIADSVLQLVQCSIDEEMDAGNPDDPLYKVHQYCDRLREKNRLGDFPDTIEWP